MHVDSLVLIDPYVQLLHDTTLSTGQQVFKPSTHEAGRPPSRHETTRKGSKQTLQLEESKYLNRGIVILLCYTTLEI